jgi:hypothetical protein
MEETMMFRRLAPLVIASLFTILSALPAAAATNVVHTTIPFNETQTFPLGPEARCFGVAPGTTLTGQFTGEVTLTEFVSGPNAGRVHVRGGDVFTVTVPSTSARATGRERFNFKARDDDTFVSMGVVHVQGTLPDGTSFKATFHFHTVVQQGDVKVDIGKVNC